MTTDGGTSIPLASRPFDAADRKVKEIVGGAVLRAHGAPGFAHRHETDERCECGHTLGDHHTDERGCSHSDCDCEVQDAA